MQEGKILLRARGTDLKYGRNTANAIILAVIFIGSQEKGPDLLNVIGRLGPLLVHYLMTCMFTY